MDEQEALLTSTKWVDGMDNLYGYLPLSAANFLVKSGKYVFHAVHPWGYIIRKINIPTRN